MELRRPEWIDVSSATDYRRCPRLYWFRHVLGLKPEIDPIAPFYGTAIHAGIGNAIRGDVDGAMRKFLAAWGDRDKDEDRKRNSLGAKRIFEEFAERAKSGGVMYELTPPPEGRVEIEDGLSDDEVPFAVDLGLGLPFIGRIDACGTHRDTHEPVGIEYKTTTRLGPSYVKVWYRNPQLIGYSLALSALMDQDVKEIFVEAIYVTTGDPLILTIGSAITDRAKEEFIGWIGETVEGILRDSEKLEEPWRPNLAGCSAYSMFGISSGTCDYCGMCMAGREWKALVENYEVSFWEPFRIKGEDR